VSKSRPAGRIDEENTRLDGELTAATQKLRARVEELASSRESIPVPP